MFKHRMLFLMMLTALMIVGCSSMTVKSDYDTSANFADFKTFNWLPISDSVQGSAAQAAQSNSLLTQRVQNAVNAQLAGKGLKKVTSNPDLLVTFHTGAQQQTDVEDIGYGYPMGWGMGGVDVYQYTEGTLMVDLINASTKKLAWRGTVQDVVDPSDSTDDKIKHINEAIAGMFSKYPPK